MSSKKYCRPVLQIDVKTNEIVRKYDSIKEAIETTGVKGIWNVLACRRKIAGGFFWKYFEEEKKDLRIEEKMENLKTNIEKKITDIHHKLLEKWNNEYQNGKIIIGLVKKWSINQKKTFEEKQRSFNIINDEVICTEICQVCKERKPITSLYFQLHRNFNETCVSGREIIQNNPLAGCRDCSKKYDSEKDGKPEYYVKRLLSNYKKLSKEWYDSHENSCAISNISLIEKSNKDWRVSIQNNKPNNKEHLPENCVKIALEFNIAERNSIKTDLVTTWKEEIFPVFLNELIEPSNTDELIKFMRKWYTNTPKENGVIEPRQIELNGNKNNNPEYKKQMLEKHLKNILQKQAIGNKRSDKKHKNKKRHESEESHITHNILFNKLIKQKMKCYYTGIPFSTHKDEWNYWSLERLDNDKNHTDENTVFICRIFNGRSQLNRKKLLYALSQQIHVPLLEDIRRKIEEELKKCD